MSRCQEPESAAERRAFRVALVGLSAPAVERLVRGLTRVDARSRDLVVALTDAAASRSAALIRRLDPTSQATTIRAATSIEDAVRDADAVVVGGCRGGDEAASWAPAARRVDRVLREVPLVRGILRRVHAAAPQALVLGAALDAGVVLRVVESARGADFLAMRPAVDDQIDRLCRQSGLAREDLIAADLIGSGRIAFLTPSPEREHDAAFNQSWCAAARVLAQQESEPFISARALVLDAEDRPQDEGAAAEAAARFLCAAAGDGATDGVVAERNARYLTFLPDDAVVSKRVCVDAAGVERRPLDGAVHSLVARRLIRVDEVERALVETVMAPTRRAFERVLRLLDPVMPTGVVQEFAGRLMPPGLEMPAGL